MFYTKMQGAGNSFIIAESLRGELDGTDEAALARSLCGLRTGPGADGMIVLVPPADGADMEMLFFNADGSSGEMCGNGARCVARYGVEHGLVKDPSHIRIRTPSGEVRGRRLSDDLYEIRLNDPSVIDLHREAIVGNRTTTCSYVELGRPGLPHAVVEVTSAELDRPDRLRTRGRALRHSVSFPKGANVTFACVTGPESARALTYERGVEDFTDSCGTGCASAALSLILNGRLSGESVTVDMPGGRLSVSLRREKDTVKDILLTGPAAVSGEGMISL